MHQPRLKQEVSSRLRLVPNSITRSIFGWILFAMTTFCRVKAILSMYEAGTKFSQHAHLLRVGKQTHRRHVSENCVEPPFHGVLPFTPKMRSLCVQIFRRQISMHIKFSRLKVLATIHMAAVDLNGQPSIYAISPGIQELGSFLTAEFCAFVDRIMTVQSGSSHVDISRSIERIKLPRMPNSASISIKTGLELEAQLADDILVLSAERGRKKRGTYRMHDNICHIHRC